MNQMKKPMAKPVVAALLVVALALVGGIYYFIVYKPLAVRTAELKEQTTMAQTNVDALTLRAEQMAVIQNKIEKLRAENKPVADFDNQKAVMETLNGIMAASSEFSISFRTEKNEEGTMVRRMVDISFRCNGYAQASQMIVKLKDAPFRCQLNSVNMQCENGDAIPGSSNLMTDPVSGTVSMTFFESI